MRKTYAYNGIILGIILGFYLGILSKSTAVTVIAMIGLSVLFFVAIRLLENALSAGVDKASQAISQKIKEHKNNQ